MTSIIIDIAIIVLDSRHVRNFCRQTVAGVKILLFLEWAIAFLCMFIIQEDILALAEGPTQGLVGTTVTAYTKCAINFTRSARRFLLSLHYDGSHSSSFVNTAKMY